MKQTINFLNWKYYDEDVHSVIEVVNGENHKLFFCYLSYEFLKNQGLASKKEIGEFLDKEIAKETLERFSDKPDNNFLTFTSSTEGAENFRKRFLYETFNNPETIRVLQRLSKK